MITAFFSVRDEGEALRGRQEDAGGRGWSDALGRGRTGPAVEECRRPLTAEEGKETHSPQTLQREPALLIPDSRPVKLTVMVLSHVCVQFFFLQ